MARILIADDAMFMRKSIRQILESNGHEVVGEAADGGETVMKFIELKPDVIILDITMPGVSGMDALKQLREIDNEVKIIICSALGQQDIIAEAIISGAQDFIVKPFNPGQLIGALEKTLR